VTVESMFEGVVIVCNFVDVQWSGIFVRHSVTVAATGQD